MPRPGISEWKPGLRGKELFIEGKVGQQYNSETASRKVTALISGGYFDPASPEVMGFDPTLVYQQPVKPLPSIQANRFTMHSSAKHHPDSTGFK